jgi:hypothetical protein
VLRGATFADQAEQKLVQSMLDAGKGFDDITAAMQGYQQAQAALGSVADQILQITDPKAYDLKKVSDAIDQQRASYEAAAQAGFITADQLTAVNGQLDRLKALQIDQVMAKYATAADQGILDPALVKQASSDVDNARQALTDAYNAQASAIQAVIDKNQQYVNTLAALMASLTTGPAALNSPSRQLAATRAEFNRLAALPPGDEERLAGLQNASQAFLDAAKAAEPTQAAYNRDLAAVRLATEASQRAAATQLSEAQQQLSQLKEMVSGQIDLKDAVTNGTADVVAKLDELLAAEKVLANLQSAAASAAANQNVATANDNSPAAFDATSYLAKNPDIGAAYPEYLANQATWATSGFGMGDTLQKFATDHYRIAGQAEGRAFADGGSFTVAGPTAGDQVPVNFRANGGEVVNVSHGDSMAAMAAEIARLNLTVERLTAAAESTARTNASIDTREGKRDIRGLYVRGETPGDPVQTAA